MNLDQIQIFIAQKKGQKILLEKELKDRSQDIMKMSLSRDDHIKARFLLSEASRMTHEQVKSRIESLVTMAIRSVFERDYKFLANIEIKRNKAEVQFMVQEGDKEPYIPKDEQGGGLLDVISFALRVVLWSLEKPRSRNIFILDEPGKWTGVLITRFGQMIKEISKELGIQILMVTHDEELMEIADRVWQVEFVNGKSVVKQVGKKVEEISIVKEVMMRRRRK